MSLPDSEMGKSAQIELFLLDNVNVALPWHRVSSSEGAGEGEDERHEE
jgi:hypothetical protein